ncbi:rhodanese-like domain-containing protein [Solirubrobacter sp. CPCC 204708]|uniref:Rhodanese-like domain-containing protein n=1 Tax=Solirubrobacter deserti TaxID=2282478 RepID=A0ABT4RPV3_9ACTN|nr:rhodanese-like domain-containing protein [Solirubrobacter deserti]MBE2317504.1 rhodanese-like domain-containing protein [Solirubrobacter deserti]MDA0140320.1 rhodanese-like domain-containing protein [Solirubrobacter deserti]
MTTATPPSRVSAVPVGDLDAARAFFDQRLAYETDPADIAADLAEGRVDYTLIDCRARNAYAKAHLPGAINLPHAEMTDATIAELPDGLLVTYCWGPACNAATKGAQKLLAAGREVKEMIGGFEYWVREGSPVEGRGRGKLAYEKDTTGLVLLQED